MCDTKSNTNTVTGQWTSVCAYIYHKEDVINFYTVSVTESLYYLLLLQINTTQCIHVHVYKVRKESNLVFKRLISA